MSAFRKMSKAATLCFSWLGLIASLPAHAQSVENGAGKIGTAGNGEIGQRQSRGDAPANIRPISRIESRIRNRIGGRINTRIDVRTGPQSQAAPFQSADDGTRAAKRQGR